jgi:hypothetical protein
MELSKTEVSKIVKQLRSSTSQEGGFLPPVLFGLGVAGLNALVSELGKLMAPVIADKVRKITGNGVKLTGQGLILAGPAPVKVKSKPRATVVEVAAHVPVVQMMETVTKKKPVKREKKAPTPIIEPPPI